ncbi:MAG: ABC transporter permease subunit [Gemmatimonadetes bacterium]|nr:ABC transporter permease subunit [Gemmatimonadota bacterium]
MSALRTLLKYELLQLARDRRTILLSVVAPLVLLPLLLWVMDATGEADRARVEDTPVAVWVDGPDSLWAATMLRRAQALPDTDSVEPLVLRRVAGPVPDSLIGSDDAHLVVRAPGEGDDGLRGLEVLYRASSDVSRGASQRLRDRLREVRLDIRDSLYAAGGLPVEPDSVYPVRPDNIAAAGREAGAWLGVFLLPTLVAIMLIGGSLVAADTLSGEKERGTLETLMTTSVSPNEVVAAKGLAIGFVALAMAVLNLGNLGIWVGFGLMELPTQLDVQLTVPGILGALVLLLPVVALLSAVLLLVSGWARTYREYQLYFLPVFLLGLVPAAAAALPGLELRSVAVLIPVANIALALRDLFADQADPVLSALAIVVTTGAAVWVALLARAGLSTERLLSDSAADRAELTGGPALFPYRVLRWFGIMWVLLLGSSMIAPEWFELRGQVLLNLLGIFLGGSILMTWRYKLPLREAWALRPVHPLVWPAVLVGAPSGFLLGIGVAEFAGIFLPVPPQVIEAFGQYLLPEGMGIVQLVLLLAILPGITEEIAFRGLLLYGLRRQLRPVALCVVVGIIFGLFHISLFRILPTAYLGTVLALVTLLTGSVFPAMVWHAINNSVALVPTAAGWGLFESGVPVWIYPIAFVGLVGSLFFMHAVGSGYPGVTKKGGAESGGERTDRE